MKLLLPLLLSAAALYGGDFRNYRRLPDQQSANLIQDAGFEENSPLWKNRNAGGWKILPGAGRNGTAGLVNTRTNPEDYVLLSQKIDLKPDCAYVFGAWIRTENLSGRGASVCVEWSNARTGKWLGGSYIEDVSGTCSWREIKGKFVAKKYSDPIQCSITFLVRKGSRGKVAFDDAYLRPDTAEWNAEILHPVQKTLSTKDRSLELASFVSGTFRYAKEKSPRLFCHVEIRDGKETLLEKDYPVKNNRIIPEFEGMAPGEKQMKLTLSDEANKVILGEKRLAFRVVPEAELQKRTVRIDSLGRTLLNGKPFLPVGIFMSGLTKAQIDIVAEAGFNTVLPYQSPTLGFNGKKGPAAVREVLDYCHAKQLKVVFSIKDAMPKGATNMILGEWNGITGDAAISRAIVEHFRDHPALLAWYVCDEIQPTYVESLRALRSRINRMDPNHPTFAVYYQFNSYERYLGGQDIFGIDPYPILYADTRDQRKVMEQIEGALKVQRLTSGGIACWAAPQYMNWGVWQPDGRKDPAVYYKKYRFPTLGELHAMIAMEMIHGIRGFIGYSYSSLFYGPDRQQFQKAWPVVKEAVAFQHLMAPFLLSEKKAPRFSIHVKKGQIYAQSYRASSGRCALLVSCVGPGEAEAEIRFQEKLPAMRTHHGSFRKKGADSWVFTGMDIASGLLYTPEK